MFLIATDFRDPSVFDGGDDAAGIRAITVTKGFGFSHVAEGIALVNGPLSTLLAFGLTRGVR
jgi:hypothetical protein